MKKAGMRILSVGLAMLLSLALTWQGSGAELDGDTPSSNDPVGLTIEYVPGYSLGASSAPPAPNPNLQADMPVAMSPPVIAPASFPWTVLESVEMHSIQYPENDYFYVTETASVTLKLKSNTRVPANAQTVVQFPNELHVISVPDFPIRNADDADRIIAYASVDSGANTVTITATDASVNASSVTGYVRVSASFNQALIGESKDVDFRFTENGLKTVTVPKHIQYRETSGSYHLFYKGGKYTENLQIEWTITLNYYQSNLRNLSDVVIYDRVAPGHQVVPGSVQVWDVGWVFQGPNNLLYTGSHTNVTSQCDINYLAADEFEIKIGDMGQRPYRIKYLTTITDTLNYNVYANTAELSAREGSQSLSRTSTNQVALSLGGGGSPVFEEALLTVIKVDEDTGERLAGAVFELYNSGGTLVTTLVTDTNGKAEYKAFMQLNTPYTLKEVHTPSAWYEPAAPRTITFTSSDLTPLITVSNRRAAQTGILEIRKVDQEGFRLSGTTFLLFQDQALTVQLDDRYGNSCWTTGSGGEQPGIARIEGLPPGTYYLLEIEAPTGYRRNTQPIPVEVLDRASGVTPVVLTNERDELDMIIIKEDEDTQERLAGAEFTAYRQAPSGKWTEVTSFSTNQLGEFRTKAIVGNYRLWENRAPEGYLLPNEYLSFTITQQDRDHGSYTLFVPNKRTSGDTGLASVLAYTHDEQNRNLGLEGAELSLYRVSGSQWNKVTDVLTGSSGKSGVIGQLEYGTYSFRPDTAPEGYLPLEDYTSFELTAANTLAGPMQVDLPFRTEYGKLTIHKYDSETGAPLSGAAFTLQHSGGEDLFVKQTTGNDGIITVSDIPYGTYRLWELDAPTGYYTAGGFTEIVIDQAEVTVRVANRPVASGASGEATLIKHDARDRGLVLAGAKFDLEVQTPAQQWETFLHGFQTDSAGQIQVHSLPYGTYRFRETAAPVGYSLASGSLSFTLGSGSESQTLYAPNQKLAENSSRSSGRDSGSGGRQDTDRAVQSSAPSIPPTAPVENAAAAAASYDTKNPGTGSGGLSVRQVLWLLSLACIAAGGVLLLASHRESRQ